MVNQELLNRINMLTRKKRSVGLTDEETNEYKHIYQEYVASIQGHILNLSHKFDDIIYDTEREKTDPVQEPNKVFQQTQIILGQRIFH